MSPILHRPLVAFGLALALAPLAAPAAVTLDLAELLAEEDDAGWRLRAALEGSSDVTSAVLTPPGGLAFALACGDSGEGTECEAETAPVASLAELLAAYPAGEYTLALNGGLRTASLPFAPVAPDGLVTVTSPADGAADVDPTPSISYVHDCANCVALSFDLQDVGAPVPVGLERLVTGTPPPSPGTVTWEQLDSYQGPKPSALADGRYAIEAASAVGSITTERLTPGDDGFEYTTGALRVTRSTFTVPEPRGLAASLAAAAALAAARKPRAGRPGARRARS